MIKIKEMIPLKKLFLPMMIFLMMISFCFASDYDKYCQSDNDGQECKRISDNVYFNRLIESSITTYTQADAGSKYPPLMVDLDNDGVYEVIIQKADEIHIYKDKNLTYLPGGTITDNIVSNVAIMDMNDDGYKEIIYRSGTGTKINFFTFWPNQTIGLIGNVSTSTNTGGSPYLGCDEVSVSCISFNPTNSDLFVQRFNFTNIGQLNSSNAGDLICQNNMPYVIVDDIDYDGTYEYIISYVGRDDDKVEVIKVEPNTQNLNITSMTNVAFTTSLSQVASCLDYVTKRVGNPLVSDVTSSYSGKEIIVPYIQDASYVEMRVIKSSDMSLKETFTTDNVVANDVVSNVFRAQIIDPDSDANFCMMAFEADLLGLGETSRISLTCGTYQSGILGHRDLTYYLDLDTDGNITDARGSFINSINMYGQTFEDFSGQNQLINSFGLLSIAESTNILDPNGDLYIMWPLPYTNASVVPFDFDDDGHAEIVGTDPSRVFVLSDSYTPQGATITDVTTNPCVDYPIKLNTTFQISITVDNAEHEGIGAARAVLYEGTVHEQNTTLSSSTIGSDGVTFQFMTLRPNVTMNNVQLLAIGNDSLKADAFDEVELLLTVSDSDLAQEFGDSSCSIYSSEVVPVVGTTTTTLIPQPVQDSFDNLADITGMAAWIWWIILMIILNVAIVLYIRAAPNILFILMGIFNTLMLILGAFFGYISTTVIVIMAVIGAFMIGIPIVLWVLAHGSKGNG